MKHLFSLLLLVFFFNTGFGQESYWEPSNMAINQSKGYKLPPTTQFNTFHLNFHKLKNDLKSVETRSATSKSSHVLMFPVSEGKLEAFDIIEAPIFHPELASKYPGIKSYAGQGVDNPSSTIRFSISNQRGLHGLIMSGTVGMIYIDPISDDITNYAVYERKELSRADIEFQCLTEETISKSGNQRQSSLKTNDQKLRKYRLALSCNAEYGNIFAGSGTDEEKTANILAQMNITMTRVNGVYERDLAITMELIANNDDIIYFGDTNSDPWTDEWNDKTQETIDNIIGDANYDIGHNFNTTGGGNAGCIGCVCTSGEKGSGYTGRSDPTGDPFDIDYVAHEMGHQFGGYHTMNTCSRSGSGSTEVEPASGSTIMGYAGICPTNIQSNSDAYFAYVNIREISANIQSGTSSGCAVTVDLSNNPPTADAGNDYTIPKSTPFVLKGTGTDADGGDVLTYCWEQNDPEEAPGSGSPESTWAQGPLFRSIEGTESPDRYFPELSEVLNGSLGSTWEVLPSVSRTMNFSLTVRDNNAGGGQTEDDLMEVTVDGDSGPFLITEPNLAITWYESQLQIVSWDVAGTDAAPVSCTNVNILLSTDGGLTFPITLLSNAPNTGSAEVTVPNNLSSTCRVMIEAVDNIFYDISNTDFTIDAAVTCNDVVPTGLTASEVNSTDATVTWDANAGAIFDVQYRETGSSTWMTVSAGGNVKQLTGLNFETEYEAQVRSRCTSSSSSYSSSVIFTTTEQVLVYCSSIGGDISDEYIGRVQLANIDNTSGASSGYSDHTNLSTSLALNSIYTITITPTWTGTVYDEGYAVWIDYNQNGSFDDEGEEVWSKEPSQETPVSGTFTIPGTALEGETRMRVTLKYDGLPTSCESFSYGEVEDYTVNIGGTGLSSVSISSDNTNSDFAKVGDEISLLFTSSDEIQTPTVTILGNSVSSSSNNNDWTASYTLTDSDLEGNVSFTIDYMDLDDVSGSQATNTTDESSVYFDKTLPTINDISIASNNIDDNTVATVADEVTVTFTSSEEITNTQVTIDGNETTPSVASNDIDWSATRIMESGDTEGAITFTIDFEDMAGNTGIQVVTTSDNSSIEFIQRITAINEHALNSRVKIYPNPSNEKVYVHVPHDIIVESIRIMDFTGKELIKHIISNRQESEIMLDTSILSSGTYVMQMVTKNSNYDELIIISR